MKRLKTFLTYLLILLAFFGVSNVLEKGLVKNMYKDLSGEVNSILNYNGEIINLGIDVSEAKATNVNGYINLTITNYSSTIIEEAYLKYLLYSKSDVLAITKYMRIENLQPGDSKTFMLKFNGTYITRYYISSESEFADEDYIFNVFGYEFNTKNILGFDLSNVIQAKSIGEFTRRSFNTISVTAKSIPWWGWFWAWTIVIGVL